MKIEAKIKIIDEEKTGTSQMTGNEWRSRMLMLEWDDMEGAQRIWAALFDERLDDLEKQGIAQGDSCQVDIVFTPRTYRSTYHKTELEIVRIVKVPGKGVAL